MWLLLCSHLIEAQENRTVELELKREVNTCKYRGDEVTISVELGEFNSDDNLFGYDLGIKFNNKVLNIDKFLFNGTLSEFFDNDKRGARVFTEGDITTVNLFGVTFSQSNSIRGELPLVAFGGNYIGDCNDTALVEIAWIDFTDEFKDIVTDTINVNIANNMIPDSSKRLKSFLIKETIEPVKKDSLIKITIAVEQSSEDQLNEFIIDLNSENGFQIHDVIELNQLYEFVEIEKSASNIRYKSFANKIINDTLMNVILKNVSDEELHYGSITLNVEPTDECSCIKIGDQTIIELEGRNPINSVIEYDEIRIVEDQKNLRISSEIDIINIMVYNLNGILLKTVDNIYEKSYLMNKEEFSNGVYLLLIETEKMIKTKKIILNNF